MDISPTGRRVVAGCLVTTAVLSAVSNATAPEFPAEHADQLAAFAEAGGRAWLSAMAFVLAQLPFVLAMLGLGLLLRPRAPRLAAVAMVLTVLGGFGHAVYGGVSLTALVMAADGANRPAYAAVLADVETSPVLVFMVLGLLGTVFGLIVLAVAVSRARFGPRWVGPALGLFLVTEFVGSAVSEWATQVSAVIYLVALVTLARAVLDPRPTPGLPAGLPGDVGSPALPT